MGKAVLIWLLAASAATFVLYWRDKRAALAGAWRTPESTLLLMGLAGGWPGGWLARHAFRHKTLKQPFRMLFWLGALGNLGALLLLWRWLD
ncbi:DUF1294 domain-containing protein [Chromobacterium sp. IIBBL 290-4]|uniref:DUF1294 domain-containing protein n=1 Tax=Chromobacterium sp. IIBBL 290-4 TaxID=2953890 RepID=UPI0020B7AD49|nr:DUF1294 domain-containing protein [Chromobacterium sp. IIBBL 290-4]UTH76185.1 DUF1294 domain-containing protein [Chromobacterium sp. IIBBL 290-4]